MDYLKTSAAFISHHPDYRNDTLNFNDYLLTQWRGSLDDENIRFLLQGIDVVFIKNSLQYNIEITQKYSSKNSARKYATAIGRLFDYLRRETDIVNPGLYEAISYGKTRENSYISQMMAYIDSETKLKENQEKEILSSEDARCVLEWADEQLKMTTLESNAQVFKKIVAALGMKYMLFLGLTYRELRKLRWKQYDSVYGLIKINGFSIRLPMRLKDQMDQVKKYVSSMVSVADDSYIFVDVNGNQWGDTTSTSAMPDYISALVGSTSLTGLIKYGISQMISVGMSDSIIKAITGASDKIIQGCILNNVDDNMNQKVNNKLVSVEMYYDF